MESLNIAQEFKWPFGLEEGKLQKVLRLYNEKSKNKHYLNTKDTIKLNECPT